MLQIPKDNLDWCVYTYRHRRALRYVIEKLVTNPADKAELLRRAETHDMDKMVLYLFFDQTQSQLRHVHAKAHHLESGRCTDYYDLLEMVLDLECAPYTKPDKPLNAFDFLHKLRQMNLVDPPTAARLYEIMHTLSIDRSYPVTEDTAGMAYMAQLGEVTQDMVLLEILDYLHSGQCGETETIHRYAFRNGKMLPYEQRVLPMTD